MGCCVICDRSLRDSDIRALNRLGVTRVRIAELVGTSYATVNRVLAVAPVNDGDDDFHAVIERRLSNV